MPPPEAIDAAPVGPRELPVAIRLRFRDRDAAALAEVYDRYHRPVWSLALSITRQHHLAQEAVQDTFVRAWQNAGDYDPGRDLGPWLLTIARRATLDLLRRELRPTRGGHEPEQDAVVEDRGIDAAWTAWQVREAVDRLTPDEAQLVRLAFFEDLSQPQIAERLSMPIGTVKSRSHRAHRRLATMLAHIQDPATDQANRPPPPGRIRTRRSDGEEGRRGG